MLNLKKIRESKGISQAAVARDLQISRQTYNNYELGKREADYETLLKLAEYFDITVDTLLSDKEKSSVSSASEAIDENERDLIILNRNAKKLSPENRKKLLDMAKLMFEEEFNDNWTWLRECY